MARARGTAQGRFCGAPPHCSGHGVAELRLCRAALQLPVWRWASCRAPLHCTGPRSVGLLEHTAALQGWREADSTTPHCRAVGGGGGSGWGRLLSVTSTIQTHTCLGCGRWAHARGTAATRRPPFPIGGGGAPCTTQLRVGQPNSHNGMQGATCYPPGAADQKQ